MSKTDPHTHTSRHKQIIKTAIVTSIKNHLTAKEVMKIFQKKAKHEKGGHISKQKELYTAPADIETGYTCKS